MKWHVGIETADGLLEVARAERTRNDRIDLLFNPISNTLGSGSDGD